MHIAICDDNIADRKHLERLLARESDRRKNTTGILYIDSYGNVDALTKSPMIYDLFFIDMTQLPPYGMETAILLREIGVVAPIVLCTSSIRYEDYAKPPIELFYIDKPFKPEELTTIIDKVEAKKKKAAPTIEVRDDLNTYYIYEEDFIYAYPDGYRTKIVLKNGRVIMQLGTLQELIPVLQPFDSFLLLGKKYVVNYNHIEKVERNYVLLSDHSKVPLSWGDKKRIDQFKK
ncbi:MAG: LytTR family transcriptional regulator DNA-binding domain-containing protein [Lachnospiraceae bacterium]|nr:LytTR family transcriptional regulator DNA-binding domain-containing protein [Lachnospiraceae bacterium]